MDKIKFAKKSDTVILPSRRSGDGCYDVYVNFEEDTLVIKPHEISNIPTGLKSMFAEKYRIAFRERGSNTKSKLQVVAGQIDSNYRGEWFVSLYNTQHFDIVIDKNVDDYIYKKDADENILALHIPYSKAVAQFAIEEVPQVEIVEVDLSIIENDITERGEGKIGSSGK